MTSTSKVPLNSNQDIFLDSQKISKAQQSQQQLFKSGQQAMLSQLMPKILMSSQDFPIGKINNWMIPPPPQQSVISQQQNNNFSTTQQAAYQSKSHNLQPNSQQLLQQKNPKMTMKISQANLNNFRSALCSNRYSTTSDNQAFMRAIQSASIDARNNNN